MRQKLSGMIFLLIVANILIATNAGQSTNNVPVAKLVNFNINVRKAVHVVSDRFISLTIDPESLLHSSDCEISPSTINMAKGLFPSYIRIGGPNSNKYVFKPLPDRSVMEQTNHGSISTNYTITGLQWIRLNNFIKETGLDMIACVNGGVQRGYALRDLSNVLELITFSDRFNYNLGWQLGYEIQKIANEHGKDMGRDVTRLRKILEVFSRYYNAPIIGPDMVTFETSADATFIKNYLVQSGDSLNAFTWHPNFSSLKEDEDPANALLNTMTQLDNYIWSKEGILKSLSRGVIPKKPIWIAESENKSEDCSFADAMVWLRRLGVSAKLGISVYMRKPHQLSLFEPTPEYWVALFHKALVGRSVLDIRPIAGNNTKLHIFGHCTQILEHPEEGVINPSLKYEKGAITVFGINSGYELARISFKIGYKQDESQTVHQYILTEGHDDASYLPKVLLNGQYVSLSEDNELPMFSPRIRVKPSSFTVPPRSIFFLVLPEAKCRACILQNNEDQSLKKLNSLLEEEQEGELESYLNAIQEVAEEDVNNHEEYVAYPKRIGNKLIIEKNDEVENIRPKKTPEISTNKNQKNRHGMSKAVDDLNSYSLKKENDHRISYPEPVVKYVTFTDDSWLSTFPAKLNNEEFTKKMHLESSDHKPNVPNQYEVADKIDGTSENRDVSLSRTEKYKILTEAILGKRNVTNSTSDIKSDHAIESFDLQDSLKFNADDFKVRKSSRYERSVKEEDADEENSNQEGKSVQEENRKIDSLFVIKQRDAKYPIVKIPYVDLQEVSHQPCLRSYFGYGGCSRRPYPMRPKPFVFMPIEELYDYDNEEEYQISLPELVRQYNPNRKDGEIVLMEKKNKYDIVPIKKFLENDGEFEYDEIILVENINKNKKNQNVPKTNLGDEISSMDSKEHIIDSEIEEEIEKLINDSVTSAPVVKNVQHDISSEVSQYVTSKDDSDNEIDFDSVKEKRNILRRKRHELIEITTAPLLKSDIKGSTTEGSEPMVIDMQNEYVVTESNVESKNNVNASEKDQILETTSKVEHSVDVADVVGTDITKYLVPVEYSGLSLGDSTSVAQLDEDVASKFDRKNIYDVSPTYQENELSSVKLKDYVTDKNQYDSSTSGDNTAVVSTEFKSYVLGDAAPSVLYQQNYTSSGPLQDVVSQTASVKSVTTDETFVAEKNIKYVTIEQDFTTRSTDVINLNTEHNLGYTEPNVGSIAHSEINDTSQVTLIKSNSFIDSSQKLESSRSTLSNDGIDETNIQQESRTESNLGSVAHSEINNMTKITLTKSDYYIDSSQKVELSPLNLSNDEIDETNIQRGSRDLVEKVSNPKTTDIQSVEESEKEEGINVDHEIISKSTNTQIDENKESKPIIVSPYSKTRHQKLSKKKNDENIEKSNMPQLTINSATSSVKEMEKNVHRSMPKMAIETIKESKANKIVVGAKKRDDSENHFGKSDLSKLDIAQLIEKYQEKLKELQDRYNTRMVQLKKKLQEAKSTPKTLNQRRKRQVDEPKPKPTRIDLSQTLQNIKNSAKERRENRKKERGKKHDSRQPRQQGNPETRKHKRSIGDATQNFNSLVSQLMEKYHADVKDLQQRVQSRLSEVRKRMDEKRALRSQRWRHKREVKEDTLHLEKANFGNEINFANTRVQNPSMRRKIPLRYDKKHQNLYNHLFDGYIEKKFDENDIYETNRNLLNTFYKSLEDNSLYNEPIDIQLLDDLPVKKNFSPRSKRSSHMNQDSDESINEIKTSMNDVYNKLENDVTLKKVKEIASGDKVAENDLDYLKSSDDKFNDLVTNIEEKFRISEKDNKFVHKNKFQKHESSLPSVEIKTNKILAPTLIKLLDDKEVTMGLPNSKTNLIDAIAPVKKINSGINSLPITKKINSEVIKDVLDFSLINPGANSILSSSNLNSGINDILSTKLTPELTANKINSDVNKILSQNSIIGTILPKIGSNVNGLLSDTERNLGTNDILSATKLSNSITGLVTDNKIDSSVDVISRELNPLINEITKDNAFAKNFENKFLRIGKTLESDNILNEILPENEIDAFSKVSKIIKPLTDVNIFAQNLLKNNGFPKKRGILTAEKFNDKANEVLTAIEENSINGFNDILSPIEFSIKKIDELKNPKRNKNSFVIVTEDWGDMDNDLQEARTTSSIDFNISQDDSFTQNEFKKDDDDNEEISIPKKVEDKLDVPSEEKNLLFRNLLPIINPFEIWHSLLSHVTQFWTYIRNLSTI